MRPIPIAVLFVALCAAGCARKPDAPGAGAPPALLPLPARIEARGDTFTLHDGDRFAVVRGGSDARRVARAFVDGLAAARGLTLVEATDGAQAGVRFVLAAQADAPEAAEGYRLEVGEAGIEVVARTSDGLYRGATTLSQLLTPAMSRTHAIELAGVRIVDAPRFRWRGAMLDPARHFQPPAFVKRFIDEMAALKLNVLHWHLTDDQGWRIEIRRYPRLTEVAAWRRPAGAAGTGADGEPVRVGGYYTQDEIRDIVRHAQARHVAIVPEIDMPGHMQAAIAAYPELGSAGDVPVVSPDWGVHSYLLNVDESTLAFATGVLDEVVALFPSPVIHIGGDEAVKHQWKASPRVQARMRELGIADETALQAWFVGRLQAHLASRGRRLIGWDEILEGQLPADAAVMSWRGSKGGIDAAAKGHDVVMAPSPDLYFDHLQDDGDDEPSGRPDLRTLADVYAFDPLAGIDVGASTHVLGAQANLWSEHMRTGAMVERAAFPRLAALAEVLWSPRTALDWNGFVRRLPPQMARWRAHGIAASETLFAVRVTPSAAGLVLSNRAGLPMRYTTDGSVPDAASPLYEHPLQRPRDAIVQAATFLDGRRVGVVARHAAGDDGRRAGAALGQCRGGLVLRLEDDAPAHGPRAFFNVDLFEPCWTWPAAPLDRGHRMRVEVGQLPYNFQLQQDAAHIVPRPKPRTPTGELVVAQDRCDGAELARVPLGAATENPATSLLEFALDGRGVHDLCLQFAYDGLDPMWAIRRIELVPGAPAN